MKKLFKLLNLISVLALLLPGMALAQEAVACESDVTVQADDWLSKIADKFYGDPLAFQAIFEATNAKAASDSSYAKIADANVVEAGWKLCLPSAEDAQALLGQAAAAPAATGGAEGGTMTGAWIGPCCVGVDNLMPLSAGGDFHFLNKIYSHLVTYDVTYSEILGDLAESWAISDDNLTWTFNLRPGVKWHDGSDFSADDVAFSLELCIDPKSGGCDRGSQLMAIKGAQDFVDGKADSIAGLEVVNPTTLNITTEKPFAPLLDILTETWIMQKASVGQIPRDQLKGHDYWFTQAIGTGPFKLVKHERGQFTELERFPDYFRGAPKLERIIRREFKDTASALLAFDKGEIDFTYLTADEVERESQNANARIIPGPSGVNNMLVFNNVVYPQLNDTFRRAILYAINRESIIENLYGGGATPVSCLYNNPAYVPADIEKFEYDPEKAKALLEESGVDLAALGDLEMSTYYGDQLSLDVMVAIQQDLANVGINVTPRQMDSAAWIKLFYEDVTFPVSFIGGGNGADPNRAYEYFYSTSVWPQGQNNVKYNNPKFDELITAGAQEMDPAERASIYQEVCRILSNDQPWIQLWETTRYGIVSTRIENFLFKPAPSGGSYYDQAELWSIKQ